MFNSVGLQGRLTKDPEIRRTGTGKAVVSVSLAVERGYKSDSGEKITDFFECVIWGEAGERFAKYNGKGDEVIVSGQLQQRQWTDKDGYKRYAVEVRVDRWNFSRGKGRPQDGAKELPQCAWPPASTFAPPAAYFEPMEDDADALPF